MNSKEDILKYLSDNKEYLKKEYGITKIGLFGSFARDEAKEDSDIDFYVEFKEKNFDNLSGLWVYLEELYNTKVDIVHKHKNNNPTLIENIQRDIIYG
jgi:predicted nucleotidyltransferase